ncbi:hypothetical protein [Mycolicibacterium aubagnense]|uniref:Uncharacterized protein n=1 Tax=Mycolicibacterium aubagnense TaxID=319707 RepID=A0ABM7IN43_9MYCO|nr:hypothetical protein [Mycolicibacterium aubagnense]TLH49049.1 hypothetical protein C1S80_28950 [Mycolicibacterium aubagnense]BBX88211.1 hypothetical protein MAUB_64120 [Mycolicibacterium aubagnense]
MITDWTGEFQRWLDGLDAKADAGDEVARKRVAYADAGISVLTGLTEPPTEDSAVLMRVRQRGRYPIWRVSHPFDNDVAVRLIVWFPEGQSAGVIVAFGGDKKKIGDAFYLSAASRADAAIDQWLQERGADDET